MKKSLIGMVAALMFGGFAFADWLSDESLERAATSWLSSDRVAQLTMKGLSFDRLTRRGSLRIVHLSPSGYIVMSGSDITDPVVCFSCNNYVEPEEGSPFYAMLEHSDSDVGKLEATGGVRASKWMDIIGNRDGSKPAVRRLMVANDDEEPSTILIEPFMKMHWNQWQPYNDFAPVYDSDADDQLYRARCPCGCVATATAQQIAYCRWPWRTGRTDTWVHSLDADGEEEADGRYAESDFTVRFDGHNAFEWEGLLDTYSWWWGDARGRISECERFPVARFVSWVDVITKMNFGRDGSGANFWNTYDSTSDWYEGFEDCNLETVNEIGVAKVKTDLEFGVPVHVGVPGHSVIAHGFASDGESFFLYLNYGWGGSADGWYKLYDSAIGGAFTGFRPKKMVQLEPLPTVSEGNIEIKWHLPHCHSNTVRRFEILTKEFGSEVGNETCDFTHAVGIPSNPKAAYVTNNVVQIDGDVDFVCENETDFLWWGSYASGMYDLPGEHLLTGTSVLSYRTQSADVGDREVEILASFDGGEWQTVSIPLLNRRVWSKSWITQSVFLGQHAGKMARFRIKVGWGGGRLFFDDFKVANVILPSVVSRACAPSMRSCPLSGLGAGKWVGVMVTPLFDEGSGQVSECQYTRLAGNANLPIPEEVSIYRTNDVNYISAEAGNSWSLRGFAEGERTIRAHHAWMGGFDVSLPGMITEQSVLSFSWYETGYYGSGTEYDVITAVFIDNCGEETTVWDMTNTVQLAERQFVEIPLACVAGKAGGIKVMFWHNGANWAGENDVMRFYSPMISDIAVPVIPEARWERKTFTALPLPRIDSIKGRDGLEIDEGLYREIGIGEDWLRVTCSETVTRLRAYPSHLSLMDDDDVTVEKITDGEFLVRMNTSKVVRRSRMILTLAAADSNGTTAYRDLSLRFDTPVEVLKRDWTRKIDALADAKPTDVFQFENNMDNSGPGTIIDWIRGGGVSYVESPLGYAIHHDNLDGPYDNKDYLELPHAWTVLTIAKTSEANNAVLFQFGSSESSNSGFALASGGKNVVTLSHWKPGKRHGDIISVGVANSSTQYHAYALRGNGRDVELFVDGIFAGSASLSEMPTTGFQFFSVIRGSGNTGLINASGECMDDWRLYDSALPAAAIACYANMLSEFDADYPAGWRVNVVAFDANGGEVLESERTIREGSPIGELPVPVRSGYTFEGWFSAARGGDKITAATKVTADVTCYARWMRPYIVQFHKYDGSGETRNQEFKVGETKSLLWLESQLKWKREGYEFIGWVPWNPDAKPRLCKYVNGQKVKDLAKEGETFHLWAAWKSSSSYRVCFNKNDGSGTKLNQVILRNKEDTLAWMDSQIGWTRPGYAFKGWAEKEGSATVKYANGAKVKNLAMDGGTKHLYAVWALKANAYVVQYHRYDGSGETREQEFKAGETKTLLLLTSQLGWSREGYEFIGWVPWNPDSKARLCKYVNGQQVKDIGKPGAKVHLYAAWKSASSYRVCFHRNDGTDVKMNQVILRNKEDSLAWMDSQIGWTRSGYKFQGWAEKEGSATVKYANGAKVKNLAMDGGTKHLYAVWKAANASTKMLAFAEHESPDVVIEGEVYGGGGAFRLVVGEGGAAVLYLFDGEGWSEERCEVAAEGGVLAVAVDGEVAYRVTLAGEVPLLE